MPTSPDKKGIFSSLKAALSPRKKGSEADSRSDGGVRQDSVAQQDACIKAESFASSGQHDVPMDVPEQEAAVQAKTGRGFIDVGVFGDEAAAATLHAQQKVHPKLLNISEEHIQAFSQHDGILMVSPFLPEDLQDCKWCIAEFRTVDTLYSTKASKVFHVEHTRTKTQLALKCYAVASMIELQKYQAMREIWFHSRLTHPSIISMYAAWVEKGKICLAIEYAPIGSAFRKLRKVGSFPEPVSAKYIVFKILCALQFLHKMGLIHRDIKPENILLTVDGCKLADLGLVINHKQEVANTCLGTFDYMAPELFQLPRKSHPMQFKDDPNAKTCDEKVDVWAMGVLMYELVYGRAPFASGSNKGPMETVNQITRGFSGHFPDLPKGEGEKLSAEGQDFIQRALAHDPRHRPSVEQLLNHPWITKHCKQPAAAAAKLAELSMSKIQGSEDGWVTLALRANAASE